MLNKIMRSALPLIQCDSGDRLGQIAVSVYYTAPVTTEKGTSRQRSGKGAIRKKFPLQKPRWEKNKLTIRYLYQETNRKPNEQLFSQ